MRLLVEKCLYTKEQLLDTEEFDVGSNWICQNNYSNDLII